MWMNCSVLAKILMVTKRACESFGDRVSSVLAKIHMVTKLRQSALDLNVCSVLAKIHMVTKQNTPKKICRIQFCSSKNSYGNKTEI